MIFIWQEILFKPLLNLLIGLYNTIGLQNLGLAIIWLTVMVRLLLLPFSLKDEKRKTKETVLESELTNLNKSYSGNPQVLREEQRKLLKKFRFRKWPKLFSLGVQGLILVILYQVFVGGIYLSKIVDSLYSWIDIPVSINTIFLGFDIAQKSFVLSLACGLFLMIILIIDHRSTGKSWKSADLLYIIGYPGATFVILWMLPGVKAIFIMTSLMFSSVLRFQSHFRATIKAQDAMIKEAKEAKKIEDNPKLPHPRDRFN